jgi:hypothetical protein
MKKFKKVITLTLVTASLISTVAFAATESTTAMDISTKDGIEQNQRGPKLDLDEATQTIVDKMIADNATMEEVNEYIISQGYELPEKNVEDKEIKLELDEATQTVVDKMIADGATKEEIGEYIISQGYDLL